MQQRAKPKAEGLNPHEVDFFFEKPASVIFAKAGRLDHGTLFVGISIVNEYGLWLRKHESPLQVCGIGKSARVQRIRRKRISSRKRIGSSQRRPTGGQFPRFKPAVASVPPNRLVLEPVDS